MSESDSAPLNRIPDETQRANDALNHYYLMGAGRSIRKLHEQYCQQTDRKAPAKRLKTLFDWSTEHHWQARIAAQKEIDDAVALAKYQERHMSEAEMLALLADQARGDMADFANVKQPADLVDHPKSHLVHKLKVTARRNKDGTITARTELELYNAQSALEKIGKKHGSFTDKIEHSGEVTHNMKGYVNVSPDDWDDTTETG
jgi:hypothetical protein